MVTDIIEISSGLWYYLTNHQTAKIDRIVLTFVQVIWPICALPKTLSEDLLTEYLKIRFSYENQFSKNTFSEITDLETYKNKIIKSNLFTFSLVIQGDQIKTILHKYITFVSTRYITLAFKIKVIFSQNIINRIQISFFMKNNNSLNAFWSIKLMLRSCSRLALYICCLLTVLLFVIFIGQFVPVIQIHYYNINKAEETSTNRNT